MTSNKHLSALLLLLLFTLTAWGLQGSSTRISPDEARALVGAADKHCIQTNTTCTDPVLPAQCTFHGASGTCRQCTMKLSSWLNCKLNNNPASQCNETYNFPYNWCGEKRTGTPAAGVNCDNRCVSPPTGCGQPVPHTISGTGC